MPQPKGVPNTRRSLYGGNRFHCASLYGSTWDLQHSVGYWVAIWWTRSWVQFDNQYHQSQRPSMWMHGRHSSKPIDKVCATAPWDHLISSITSIKMEARDLGRASAGVYNVRSEWSETNQPDPCNPTTSITYSPIPRTQAGPKYSNTLVFL